MRKPSDDERRGYIRGLAAAARIADKRTAMAVERYDTFRGKGMFAVAQNWTFMRLQARVIARLCRAKAREVKP